MGFPKSIFVQELRKDVRRKPMGPLGHGFNWIAGVSIATSNIRPELDVNRTGGNFVWDLRDRDLWVSTSPSASFGRRKTQKKPTHPKVGE